MSATIYPYRMALDSALKDRILTYGVPAINDGLTQLFGVGAPQFSNTSVVVDDLVAISEPTICIVDAGEDSPALATGQYQLRMYTQIHVKALTVGSNSPEAFGALNKCAVDNLRDLFTSTASRTLLAVDGSGNPTLPAGQKFYNGRWNGYRRMSLPVQANGTSRVRGVVISLVYTLNFPIGRALPVGG